jgi:hypothetical protein
VENCPIYFVKKDEGMLMRIEYDVMGNTNTWAIEVINGFSKTSVAGNMNESDKIKKIAEDKLHRTIKSL